MHNFEAKDYYIWEILTDPYTNIVFFVIILIAPALSSMTLFIPCTITGFPFYNVPLSLCFQFHSFTLPLFIPLTNHSATILYVLPFFLFPISLICFLAAIVLFRKKLIDSMRSPSVLLEITPPWDTKQSAFATGQLFTTIHSLGRQIAWFDGFLGKKKTYAMELVSTKEGGIRYLIKTPVADAPILKNNLLSFLPGVKIKETNDYFPKDSSQLTNSTLSIIEFSLSNHFALPLQTQSLLTQHDPIAYISGQMTQLQSDEFVSLQVIITPVTQQTHGTYTKKLKTINSHIYHGLDISQQLQKRSGVFPVMYKTIGLLFGFLFYVFYSILTTIGDMIFNDGKTTQGQSDIFFGEKRKKFHELSPQKQRIHKMVEEKIGKELFEVTIRAAFALKDPYSIQTRTRGIISSFSPFQNEGLQGFHVKRNVPFIHHLKPFKRGMFIKLKYRLFSFSQNPILSVSEVASIFHFPYFPTTQTEDLVKSRSQTLPAPLSLKQTDRTLDIVFANNTYAESTTAIGLTGDERRRHTYIIGATGTGKTTLLKTMIVQDVVNNNGCAVIDPHGELIEQILSEIPQKRIQDVILFDPDDTEFPIGLNLLEIPKRFSEKERERYKGFLASSIVSVFSKISTEKSWGPRMEYILRNTTLTALETEDPTIFTMQRLLLDYQYRKQITISLKNPALLLFWKEFKQMGSFQRAQAVAPITNKLGKFIGDPLSAHILGQKKASIDFQNTMDTGKILLVDVSKGKIGEDMSTLFGALITAKLELAAQQRIRIPEEKRKDFFLYIDEFQNFASDSFAKIMSESRKYRLNAILAHQTIAQIPDRDLVNIILANTGTMISFRTGSPLDEDYILPYFRPLVEKGEITNLPLYNFYIKINGVTPENGFSGETIYNTTKRNERIIEKIRHVSQETYATPKEIVEKAIQAEFYDLVTADDEKHKKEAKKNVEKKYLKRGTKETNNRKINGTKKHHEKAKTNTP